METLHAQLLRAWQIHESKNLALLDGIKPGGLDVTLSTRGGRTVGQQLVHVVSVRRDQLQKMRRDLAEGLPAPTREDGHDGAVIREAFEATGRAIETLVESTPDGEVKVFKGGLATFVAYLIAHEAHHRGGIVLTLKQCRKPLSKDDGWKLWGWSKG